MPVTSIITDCLLLLYSSIWRYAFKCNKSIPVVARPLIQRPKPQRQLSVLYTGLAYRFLSLLLALTCCYSTYLLVVSVVEVHLFSWLPLPWSPPLPHLHPYLHPHLHPHLKKPHRFCAASLSSVSSMPSGSPPSSSQMNFSSLSSRHGTLRLVPIVVPG